ncbi:hypothetical protein ACH5RR_019388 [Cinchona calisaya]|uniref:Omega-hydroxypalmitate O-feruloyl transferase n=1 Tax=Cinchona calisaya TaxID=153742 RepID=A0ABD2ZQ54_9GENT
MIHPNMSTSVHMKGATLITPSDPTPTHILHLSALDSQLFLRFTVEYLLAYKPSRGLDKPTTTARLKAALARALVPYYPLAGRVRTRSDGSGLEVVCRAQGAVFIEATSECTSSEFDDQRAPSYCNQWRKLLSLQVDDVLSGAPPLVVQLTWLSDGAATLGVGFSHCMCDGIGSGEFLNSFAELASGTKRGVNELKPAPIWARHLMDPSPLGIPCLNSASHPEFKKVPDTCGFLSRFTQERLTPTSVTFDRKCLNELKKSATHTGRLSESLSCTSFEVLSAHIWRSWAKSINLPSKQVVKLLFSINIRNRVKPSLPSGYYGNAFVLGCAEICVKDLIEKGLGHATELVKRAKERVDDGYVREVVDSVSSARACPDSVGVLILSQWSRLGLDRVDFGMGRPVQVGPVCSDRYCILSPVYDQRDAVKVNLAVPTSAVHQYVHLLKNNYS